MKSTHLTTLAKLHKSLTVWFNTFMLAVIAYLPDLASALPQLQEYLEPSVYKTLGLVLVGGNILLRLKTKNAIADK